MTFQNMLGKMGTAVRSRVEDSGFEARPGTFLHIYDSKNALAGILAGVGAPLRLYDLPAAVESIGKALSKSRLGAVSFHLAADGFDAAELEQACLGWALACHKFDIYKKDRNGASPRLAWPAKVDRARVQAMFEGMALLRNLVNTPANDLGPAELEKAARKVARKHKAAIAVTAGEKLERGFPLIHAVGVSSPRAPRLIDITWGKATDPKLTLVGKGVCYDTGGLNLKPGPYMLQMKKDMGGSAHVLGIAWAIMALKLPVRLRVLIPAVENSVSGTSFRPRDVYKSRKGLTVETSDTDAEGRLVLADALALACEENPDMLIDCATLTGSARAGLGYDIPAIFSNRPELANALKNAAVVADDPLWPLPLWHGYTKELSSDIADLNNIGTSPAGAITAALFLEHFIDASIPWLHIDMYAWEQNGRPGRPRGGADTGMRAILTFVEQRYGKKSRK
jgi:leucyl aminopeptidase